MTFAKKWLKKQHPCCCSDVRYTVLVHVLYVCIGSPRPPAVPPAGWFSPVWDTFMGTFWKHKIGRHKHKLVCW
jgi:hypothetical protein